MDSDKTVIKDDEGTEFALDSETIAKEDDDPCSKFREGSSEKQSQTPPQSPAPSAHEILENNLREEEEGLGECELAERHISSQQLKETANNFFKDAHFSEAISKYSEAISICPLRESKDRSVLYANKAAALMGISENEAALQELNRALEINPDYFKALERRARLNMILGNLDDAMRDYERLLNIKPKHCEYLANLAEIKDKIRIRNEELQSKMMDSLKVLGNVILKPFGLSTDNFKMEQNADGTYNMQLRNNQ